MMLKRLWCGAILAIAPIVANGQGMTGVNPVYRRAQAMVNDGNAVAGRTLVDSMIAVAPPGSNDYAEGVYWRAVLAATAAEAEMDYRRIVVDYSLSPRVDDALIRLAQLEIARANYDGALRHLTRLVTEHPQSPARARAGYWTARALFDKKDIQGGCAATADALARTVEDDAELRNQISYLNQQCAGVVLVAPGPSVTARIDSAERTVIAVPDPVKLPALETSRTEPLTRQRDAASATIAAPRTVTQAASGERSRAYSVQVAAYKVESQADAMVARLKKGGYEARVDGKAAPFRVRIGRYATPGQASAVQRSLKIKQIAGFVVQADIR